MAEKRQNTKKKPEREVPVQTQEYTLRDEILSKGGTEHPMTLYKNFKGSEPTIDALLKRNGIVKGKNVKK